MQAKLRILVTGATGFLGRALVSRFIADGNYNLRAAHRSRRQQYAGNVEEIRIGELSAETEWRDALSAVDVVVHTAARAHIMREEASDPLTEFIRINTEGSLNLAAQAAAAGVRRFIFISSIKVNGESTPAGRPFTAADTPAPRDPYAISKRRAEEGLRKIATTTGMEMVIIRPPLIYGPGVKANFYSLMDWIYHSRPLPFGAVRNKRSLVALDNLIDLIVTCIEHSAAAGETFLVSDGEDLSSPELVRRLGIALDKPARLFPVPGWVLRAAAIVIGKRTTAQRLLDSLQVDIGKTCAMLNWHPPRLVDAALRDTGRYFLESIKNR